MKWQTADWFIVVIVLAVVVSPFFGAKYFVGRGRRGAQRADDGSDGPPSRAEEEHERQGPTLNMGLEPALVDARPQVDGGM